MNPKNKAITAGPPKTAYGFGMAVFFCLLFFETLAQTSSLRISGKTVDKDKTVLPGVVLEVVETGVSTVSDANGDFVLLVPEMGFYTVKAVMIGFQTWERKLEIVENREDFILEMEEQLLDLEEAVIYGKSQITEAREQAIQAGVIDLQQSYSQPSNLTELINRSAGVRIRQTGGLGAVTDISLNGFQGKSIRYFKDGVPMDYLGEGFSISALPVNMLERVEVYKGILPVSLGSDALGGAVNLISRKPKGDFIELAYEIASFNTHRINLNAHHTNETGRWFVGVDGFFNHSDNDYKANVKVTNPDTKNQLVARLPLFHNGYTGYFVQGFTGIQNVEWTDELRFEVSLFEINREQQHPALMTDPYGAVTSRQYSAIPAISYRKGWEKLGVEQFLTYNNLIINRTDTLPGQYDWYGQLTIRSTDRVGESGQPSLSTINNYHFISRTNIAYQLSEDHSLELNNVYTSTSRDGKNPYGPRFMDTDIDVLSLTSRYRKLVTSLGWAAYLNDKKWNNLLMVKYFQYNANGVESWQSRPIYTNEASTIQGSNWGVGNAIKYQPNHWNLFRVSAEYANRLPDHMELFGNGIWVVQNFGLKPERSLNFNLGMRVSMPEKHSLEVNTFYRLTRDMILLVPILSPYARYENQENVRGVGVELDGNIALTDQWHVNGNITWQEQRLFGIENPTDNWKNGARLRNTPYAFGNIGVNYFSKPVFSGKALLKLYGTYSFLKEFYLETIPRRLEPNGLFGSANVNTELIIPNQHLINLGANLRFPKDRIALGVEVKNLLNKDLFDNYRVQQAGRSLHLKLNYSIQQSH